MGAMAVIILKKCVTCYNVPYVIKSWLRRYKIHPRLLLLLLLLTVNNVHIR